MPSMLRRALRATAFFAVLMAAPVSAPVMAAPAAIQLTAEQVDVMKNINTFFNSYKSLRGDFVQISPKGNTVKGVMMIAKPGRLRFEYAPPTPLLIVSDGKWLTIKNTAKEKGDQVPLAATPLKLIVAPQVDILREAVVTSFDQQDNIATVALADRKGSMGGQIVLVFDTAANELQQWIIVDGKGQRTTVQIGNLERDVALNPKLFQVTIKRRERDSK